MLVDTRGEFCPYPVLMAKKAMERAGEEEIVVLTDHAPSVESIPQEAQRCGFTCTVGKEGAAQWRIVLRRIVPPQGSQAG